MHRSHMVSLFGLVLCASGCAAMRASRQPRIYAAIDGVIVKAPISGEYTFVDLDEVRVERTSTASVLRPFERIETAVPVRIEVAQMTHAIDRHYFGVLGPESAPGGIAEGGIRTSDPALFVAQGWAWAWGRWPIVRTRYVYIGSTSTTLAAYVDGSTTRIYAVRKEAGTPPIELICERSGALVGTLANENDWIELIGCAPAASGTFNLATEPFLLDTRPIVEAAGWDE